MRRARILIADDHALLREAFQKLLERDYEVVGTAADGQELVAEAERLKPDVIITDIAMPNLNGLEACEQIGQRIHDARLIFLTVDQDRDTAEDAVRRGASGYVLKASASSELFEAIDQVMAGRIYVTPAICDEPIGVFLERARRRKPVELSLRQREVLQLLAEGKSMKEAAARLRVTPRTIQFHKYTMMQQLGLETSAQLVQYAVSIGLVGRR
jgi:DNA-binding NarL/FixJ family response regulator